MDTALLSQSALFRGANSDEIEAMLGCLVAKTRCYGKGALIYGAGRPSLPWAWCCTAAS